MHFALPHLFCRHAAASFDKQRHLSDLVETIDWHFNMESGILSFGDRYQWRAQVIGTESEEANTWLWAWANEASNIPPELLQAAFALRELGQQFQFEELTEPELSLEDSDAHYLAMIASGVCNANAYYRAPYEGGAAYLLIMDEAFPRNAERPLARIAAVFPQLISAIEIDDHKAALAGYLESYGLAYEQQSDMFVVKEDEESVLRATFDEQNRLSQLEVTVEPSKQKTPV